ncbi:toll/interleukin-1 receptor domain-containing protein [Micromonospora sp. NPDC047187]|uniref:toll/interleukin-1 receptor domain-containing protein n=1 Tax=Micromonospora sp. NPDC047187 TaxID=3155262 RepID=UPI0033FEF244
MHHVFISYSRADLAVVDHIAGGLERAGIRMWIDRRDIPVSVPWWAEVTTGIGAADLFVICDSANWRASQACLLESRVAASAHKSVLTVDLNSEPAGQIVDRIVAAVRHTPPTVWTHTEVTVRTDMWTRSGRGRLGLASGGLLRRMRQLDRDGTPPLDDDAHAFLEASRSRHRRRLATSWGSAVLAVVAVLTCGVGTVLRGYGPELLGQYNQVLGDLVPDDDAAPADPYQTLATQRDRIRDGALGYLDRMVMTRALAVPVPDHAFVVPGRPAGFLGTATGDSATVVAADGRRYRGSPVPVPGTAARSGPPLLAVASDHTGRVQVRREKSRVTVVSGDRTVLTLPPGAPAVVAAEGSRAVAMDRGRIRLADLRTGGADSVAAPSGCCTAVAFTADAVALGHRDGSVWRWRPGSTPTRVWSWPGTVGGVDRMVPSPDGSVLAVTRTRDGLIHLLRGTGLGTVRTLAVARSGPLAFSPDGRLLAAATGADVVVFDTGTGTQVTQLAGSVGAVRHLTWSADSRRVFAATEADRVVRWQVRQGRTLVDDPRRWFVAVSRPTPDGRLVAADRDGGLTVLDAAAETVVAGHRTSARGVTGMSVSPDGRHVALTSFSSAVSMSSLAGEPERMLDAACTAVRSGWSPDSRSLYLTCSNGEVRMFEAATRRRVASATLNGGGAPSTIAVAPTGEVYVGNVYSEVYRFDAALRTHNRLVESPCGLPMRAITVSASGDDVVMAGDGAVHMSCMYEAHRRPDGSWNRVLVQQPVDIGEQARAVDVTPDATMAVVGLSDGRVRLWRPDETLDPIGSFREGGGEIWGAAFTRDSTKVVVGSRDGMVIALPACRWCGTGPELADQADAVLRQARDLGLTDR